MDPISSILGAGEKALVRLPGLRRDWLRKRLLRNALQNPTYKWISIETLAKAAALPGNLETTRDLLVSIHARPSRKSSGPEVWGLVSRVGA